ncbi:peptidase S41 [Candidatus Thiomargarita nelsonii]|uniref:Peptidase S41 n=1 Tax=Candidatus Thiomargarita nelsonii TaxID=1003181 RepID=A0A0A6PM09_9GAMM|nr:peptidase S41 [Candidatus Thiomargarita nelsonii]
MRSLFRYLPTLLIGVVLGSFIAIAGTVFADRNQSAIPFEELRTFTEVFHRIKSDYVEEVDDKTLLENAIAGMLSGLDPHSNYLTPDVFKEIQIGTTGEFGGLGIEVGMENGFIKVIAPIDDTPAQRAGMQAGDLIIRLDDAPVKGMTLTDAVKIMRGKPGTSIKLTVVRDTEDKPIHITIVRDIIKVKSVKSRTLAPGYGYVRISHFQTQTVRDLEKAIYALKKENKGRLNGLVLDLRNNPGGVLNGAVEVSDSFLPKGLIVYTQGRVDDSSFKFKAHPRDLINGAPMVVLVNGGSASASEIVAGALQDHKRAIIMGTKTFGKGSVQTILPMNNDAALKLTTARYYTPLGRSIQAEGIEPDILLNNVEIASVEKEDGFLKESDLTGHLENGNSEKSSKKKDSAEEADVPLIKKDYAVYEALNLLKGLNIIKTQRN